MAIDNEPAVQSIGEEERGVLMGAVLGQMVVDPFFADQCFVAALENSGGIVAALEHGVSSDDIRLTDDQLLAAAMGAHRIQRRAAERRSDLA